MWPLVLDMDMLKELEVNVIQTLSSLEVSATSLRLLTVHKCFGMLPQWGRNTVVKVLAPRLEEIYWSGYTPSDLIFLSGIRSVRGWPASSTTCLGDGHMILESGRERLLEMCSAADKIDVSIKISDGANQSMLDQKDQMDYIEQIPNVRNNDATDQ
ncbi:hypothetical protein E2562_000977 [Oryza meyeriana var. granulata]|uniref:Uncharacterized protein n=1 Tax=Oryza meyeriana var. granulata TaxID=110450 RepID=A0A6G1CYH1_9ORYZ|nr:hypothetical protein E2562_000977 [Oryza meyeriana var. granulata]